MESSAHHRAMRHLCYPSAGRRMRVPAALYTSSMSAHKLRLFILIAAFFATLLSLSGPATRMGIWTSSNQSR